MRFIQASLLVALLISPAHGTGIELLDGRRIEGEIVYRDSQRLIIRQDGRLSTYRVSEIKQILPVEAAPSAAAPVPKATEAVPAKPAAPSRKPKVDPETAEEIRAALHALAESDRKVRRAGETYLTKNYAVARHFFVEAARAPDLLARAYLARLIGDHGTPKDAPVLTLLLGDPKGPVRLAATMALRRLDARQGAADIRRALLKESVPAIQKMMAKALEMFEDHDSVEALITVLERERNAGVQQFCRRALKRLTGKDFGVDGVAWLEWYRRTKSESENNAYIIKTKRP